MGRRRRDGTNHDYFDRFTLVHFTVGAGAGALGVQWPYALAGAVVFEIAEQRMKRAHPEIFPNASPDSFGNAAVDIGSAVFGAYLGQRMRKKRRS